MEIAFKIFLSIATLALSANAEPFKPESDSFVVEKLPKSLMAIQRSASRQKSNLPDPKARILLAREYLQIAQRTSDPAFVRYAEQLLNGLKPNADVLFLLAVINQHKH